MHEKLSITCRAGGACPDRRFAPPAPAAAAALARIQSSDVCPPPTCCVRGAGRVAHTIILRQVDLRAMLWWHYSADCPPSGRFVLAEGGERHNRFTDAISPASIIARSYLVDDIENPHIG